MSVKTPPCNLILHRCFWRQMTIQICILTSIMSVRVKLWPRSGNSYVKIMEQISAWLTVRVAWVGSFTHKLCQEITGAPGLQRSRGSSKGKNLNENSSRWQCSHSSWNTPCLRQSWISIAINCLLSANGFTKVSMSGQAGSIALSLAWFSMKNTIKKRMFILQWERVLKYNQFCNSLRDSASVQARLGPHT